MKSKISFVAASMAALLSVATAIPAQSAPLPVAKERLHTGGNPDLTVVRERGGVRYWRGHRGYRHHRHGYRRHGGYWFPPAAFATGVIIGGALAGPSVRYRPRGGNRHIRWCYNHYKSYRASDNTFQPYNGPRRACRSPFR